MTKVCNILKETHDLQSPGEPGCGDGRIVWEHFWGIFGPLVSVLTASWEVLVAAVEGL